MQEIRVQKNDTFFLRIAQLKVASNLSKILLRLFQIQKKTRNSEVELSSITITGWKQKLIWSAKQNTIQISKKRAALKIQIYDLGPKMAN